jgi:hypothetical protein
MNDDKTPMERFDDLLSQIFKTGKPKPRPEEDAEEIMEGGVPPTGPKEVDEEPWEPQEWRERDE